MIGSRKWKNLVVTFTRESARPVLFAVVAFGVLAFAVSILHTLASSPGTGTITPTSAPLTWDGTAVGGTSNGEGTCTEGVNCDTFLLTVDGTQADWAGKHIQVPVSWVVLANDYDVYVHKCPPGPATVAGCNAGPVIDSSTGGAPSTSEKAEIDPAVDGTGVFSVHAVYFTGAAADQYHARALVVSSDVPPPPTPPLSPDWNIVHHGTCCEGNLAAFGSDTYVLLPELTTGNDIKRSTDNGETWTKKYPPADVSEPFGIEGDLQAFDNDVVFFGTELANGVAAHSDNRGDSWVVTQFPVPFVANDQAWSYLAPFPDLSPTQLEPYVLAGWFRIGSVAVFSFDGGLTWPIQTPLVGNDGSGPEHVVCQQTAHDPTAPGDTRIANANFNNQKSGRHGSWGTDRKFYWTEPGNGNLFICKTSDFGANWTGIKHPIVPGPAEDYVVSHSAFDEKGTLYVLHGNKLYVSFNQGESIAFVHTLPRWGDAGRSDSGADQFFVVDNGTIHLGLLVAGPEGAGHVYYERGRGVDTANPVWNEELVDVVGNVRLDFMQIVLNGNDIPTISYTTPGTEVTTASRNAPMPVACTALNVALASAGSGVIASSSHLSGNFPALSAVNGDRTGNTWGTNTGGWNDGSRNAYPDLLEVDFALTETIDEINVFTLQNNWTTAGAPTVNTPATGEGILDFIVQYCSANCGTALPTWTTIPGGDVTGNDKAWRQFTFPAVTTSKIRVVVNNSRNNWSRIVELEALRSCP